jgi:hypothetical protein
MEINIADVQKTISDGNAVIGTSFGHANKDRISPHGNAAIGTSFGHANKDRISPHGNAAIGTSFGHANKDRISPHGNAAIGTSFGHANMDRISPHGNVFKNDMNNSIMVNFDEKEYKFTLYDNEKNLLGFFTSTQLIKYVTSKISSIMVPFLDHIEIGGSYNIIETYICKVSELEGFVKIILYDHIKSPFMGNIEMMMKLFKGISEYENKLLNAELIKYSEDTDVKKKISNMIKQLMYLLLNHSLKLIAAISDKIKDDDSKRDVRDMLLKYSVGIVYKISNFMKFEIENKIDDYKVLESDLVRIGNIKLGMYKKIDDLCEEVKSQEEQINIILSTSNNFGSMIGGEMSSNNSSINSSSINNTSNTTTTESKITTSSSDFSDMIDESGKFIPSESSGSNNESDCYYTESGEKISNMSYLTSSVFSQS